MARKIVREGALGCILLCCIPIFSISQVINGYAKVTSLSGSTITLSNVNEAADSFEDGEKVLLIQMQDNVIGTNTANTNTFGTIATIGSAGNYQLMTIASHTETAGLPSTMTFTTAPTLSFTFNANSSVQIVSFKLLGSPNYTTTSAISALAWDGNVGGIVAFEVLGTLYLNHSVTANFAGFRGGLRSTDNGSGCLNSVYITASTGYGYKGEGIYKNTNTAFNNARAKMANGGGGGLSHNAGGGGGGNIGTGGLGGIGWQCTAANTGHGLGGQSLFNYYSMNRIYMGGGGGGGQMNNTVGTNGGNGGGIVFIKANQLVTPTTCTTPVSITANGQTASNSANDGSGGGGAAGTIVLQVNTFTSTAACPLKINANGGNGGTVGNGGTHGAGGSGGQGAIVFLASSPTSNVITTTLNGNPGCNNSIVPCTTFAGTSPEPNNTGVIQLIPLGVLFSNFTAEPIGRSVLLNWSTASEINSDYFSIERSINGLDFVAVGEIDAAGESQSELNYQFTDVNAFATNDQYYYRIREVDFDGKQTFTDLKFVKFDQPTNEKIVVFPNPFTDLLTVLIPPSLMLDGARIELSDEMNRQVKSYTIDGSNQTFMLEDLPRGIYFLTVLVENQTFQMVKVVK
ncbi:MAG: hypothetical protein RI922_69 [Bacteroidota bacterium]|jgi:hypothetical protein